MHLHECFGARPPKVPANIPKAQIQFRRKESQLKWHLHSEDRRASGKLCDIKVDVTRLRKQRHFLIYWYHFS